MIADKTQYLFSNMTNKNHHIINYEPPVRSSIDIESKTINIMLEDGIRLGNKWLSMNII